MTEWYAGLGGLDKTLLIVAIIGGVVFLFQLVMMLIGGDADGDGDGAGGDGMDGGDVDVDGDVEPGTDVDEVHADSDTGFKLLSMQSISVFLMMFGLVGLGLRGEGSGVAVSLGGGFITGLVCMYGVAKAFQLFRSLQSSGTIKLKNAVGKEARVYLTIKADEPGQVQVEVQGHLGIYDARSRHGEEIPTDTPVKVVGIVNNLMIVERVKE
jgi:membrane protein implicated in regulation of membrane protease activity